MYAEYLKNQGVTDTDELTAAEHIDVLTYGRIVDFDKLTDLQKGIIKRVHDELTLFDTENADMINSYLSNYSINGVSMSFGNSWNLLCVNGIAVPTRIYSLLKMTGLCYAGI